MAFRCRADGAFLYNTSGSLVGGFNVNISQQGRLWVSGESQADVGYSVGYYEIIDSSRNANFTTLSIGGTQVINSSRTENFTSLNIGGSEVINSSRNANFASLAIGGTTRIGSSGDIRPRYFPQTSRPTLEDGEIALWWDGSTFWLLSRVGSNYFRVAMQSV